mmetsp:Transcript_2432/g.4494  ORF Transcript_2432/g.4494 Transcript_2432/m.4494 type:complete len:103 (+) Transcript_2432:204-512(+)
MCPPCVKLLQALNDLHAIVIISDWKKAYPLDCLPFTSKCKENEEFPYTPESRGICTSCNDEQLTASHQIDGKNSKAVRELGLVYANVVKPKDRISLVLASEI